MFTVSHESITSCRVKCVVLDPSGASRLLCSFHNGKIQMWDYHLCKELLDIPQAHSGPVRCVSWCPLLLMKNSEPSCVFFASGGDDCVVKLWHANDRECNLQCVGQLLGHVDYVRTVDFHPRIEGLVASCSDDTTARLWDWKTQQCLWVVTGHNHYVMCGKFHPEIGYELLFVTASLDCDAKIWYFGDLVKEGNGGSYEFTEPGTALLFPSLGFPSKKKVQELACLERHTKGLNWAAFVPVREASYETVTVVTSADDRTVRLWTFQYTSGMAPRVISAPTRTFFGHTHNVSSVLCLLDMPFALSVGEDCTLRLWKTSSEACESSIVEAPHLGRLWSLDAQWCKGDEGAQLVCAIGHDQGFSVGVIDPVAAPFMVNIPGVDEVRETQVPPTKLEKFVLFPLLSLANGILVFGYLLLMVRSPLLWLGLTVLLLVVSIAIRAAFYFACIRPHQKVMRPFRNVCNDAIAVACIFGVCVVVAGLSALTFFAVYHDRMAQFCLIFNAALLLLAVLSFLVEKGVARLL